MSTENIDLNVALQGTKPLVENVLPRLVNTIQVSEPIEEVDIPDRLIVTVNGGEVIHYISLASLPTEVQALISQLPGSAGNFVYSRDTLVRRAKALLEAAEKLPGPTPKFAVGDAVRVVQDEWGVMVNKELLGKVGTVLHVANGSSMCAYTVDVDDLAVDLMESMLEKP